MKLFLTILLALSCSLMMSCASVPEDTVSRTAEKRKDIVILHTNDVHGAMTKESDMTD